MTTDRELLDLAAKAAGVPIVWKEAEEGDFPEPAFCYIPNTSGLRPSKIGDIWNPLINDGDALRLSVDLCLETEFAREWVNVGNSQTAGAWILAAERYRSDKRAATRRAIVRAAAALAQG